MPRKQTNYAASSAAVGRGMVKPRAPGLGDEASNKVAQLRDIITRLRAQIAAADKLKEACESLGFGCRLCGGKSRMSMDGETWRVEHSDRCPIAVYLASRAP